MQASARIRLKHIPRAEDATHYCGQCRFSGDTELFLSQEEKAALKQAAQYILDHDLHWSFTWMPHIIDLLCMVESFRLKKLYCKQECAWTHFLEPACALWRPKEPAEEQSRACS